MTELRPELPGLPARMRTLPVDQRGYPVPWFVAWLDGDGTELPRGEGTPDFRVIGAGRIQLAVAQKRCWICGDRLGRYLSFVSGPMCAVNRTSAEPPSHFDCADYAARACPFLVRPHARRRENRLPDDSVEPAGIALKRNPGVAMVWTTKTYRLRRDPNGGTLITFGDPEHVRWYAEGRTATRAEVEHSIETGLPALREVADAHGDGEALDADVERARALLPA